MVQRYETITKQRSFYEVEKFPTLNSQLNLYELASRICGNSHVSNKKACKHCDRFTRLKKLGGMKYFVIYPCNDPNTGKIRLFPFRQAYCNLLRVLCRKRYGLFW
jgi:hypothetical protein